ncbi:hypothetical protein [Micromonospora chalcea]|uniref:hypothetical protein n=1 Tax=Micromonospora chalcea TaxID=1874 RepID=UPI003D707903
MTEAIAPEVHVMDVQTAYGIPLRVLAVPAGVAGPNRFRAPADRAYALVEFYDRRYPRCGAHGQFTGAYYDVPSVLDTRDGLNLHGGVQSWTVDAETMGAVRRWLSDLLDSGALDAPRPRG